MAIAGSPRQANLGFFGPFMRAWGAASPEARISLYLDALAYEGGREPASELLQQTSELLGIPIPATAGNG